MDGLPTNLDDDFTSTFADRMQPLQRILTLVKTGKLPAFMSVVVPPLPPFKAHCSYDKESPSTALDSEPTAVKPCSDRKPLG